MSNTTPAKLAWRLTIAQKLLDEGVAGHADSVETSLLMHYDRQRVDLGTLPPRGTPLHSWEFSIVDGIGFTPHYHRDHVVRNDPRESTGEAGEGLFELAVDELAADVERLMA